MSDSILSIDINLRLREKIHGPDFRYDALLMAYTIWQMRPLILDTETTGLDERAEIVDLAILDTCSGDVLLDRLIKPTRPIPPEAEAVHHITNEMVKDASRYDKISPAVNRLLEGRVVMAYNAAYDMRMITQTTQANGINFFPSPVAVVCLMHLASAWVNMFPQNSFGKYKWLKQEKAAELFSLKEVSQPQMHRAKDDVIMAREIFLFLVETYKKVEREGVNESSPDPLEDEDNRWLNASI